MNSTERDLAILQSWGKVVDLLKHIQQRQLQKNLQWQDQKKFSSEELNNPHIAIDSLINILNSYKEFFVNSWFANNISWLFLVNYINYLIVYWNNLKNMLSLNPYSYDKISSILNVYIWYINQHNDKFLKVAWKWII